MNYKVSHRTTFVYSQPVSISRHALHLLPRAHPFQKSHRAALTVEPRPAVNTTGTDYFGNRVTFLTIQEPHMRLAVHALSMVGVTPSPAPDPASTPAWEEVVARLRWTEGAGALAAYEFAFASPAALAGDEVADYARRSFPPGRPILAGLLDLMHRIRTEFVYDSRATTVSTPVDEVFRVRRGVCQDFAHLMIAGLRGLGLAVRYVSGYLLTYPPPGKEKLVGSDASHAWVSVWCGPDVDWIDFDPTNDKIPSTEHITLAWGRDYSDVSPIKGVMIGGGEHKVEVAVDVSPSEKSA